MAEASKKPIFQKLGLKPGSRGIVLNQPHDLDLGKPPSALEGRFAGQFDFILAFHESARALKADLSRFKKTLTKGGAAWVAYRKGGVTDLGRDSIHGLAPEFGLEGVSLVSVDDMWSAFKLMHPKAERG